MGNRHIDWGNRDTVDEVAMKFLRALPLALLLLPTVALASAPRTFEELANLIVSILDSGVGLLVLAGIVIYFYGVSTNIMQMKDESGKKVRAYFGWGILVIFIMVSIWGILDLLQNTLFGSNPYNPTTGEDESPASFQVPQTFE